MVIFASLTFVLEKRRKHLSALLCSDGCTSQQSRRNVYLLLEQQTVQHSQGLDIYFTVIKNYIPPAHLIDLTKKNPSSVCEAKNIQLHTEG